MAESQPKQQRLKENQPHSKRSTRLHKRLDEINSQGEKELKALLVSLEKVKAAFKAQRS